MKRASRRNKLVVGGFVLVMGLLAAAAVLLFSDDVTMFKSSSRYFASFKNTSGLHIGAPLKMGGVDIGSVVDIAISTTNATPQILLTLLIYAPHNALIKNDSEATLDTQGMLGDKYINVTPGSPSAATLPASSFLKTKEGPEMAAIVSQSTDIIKKVSDTTGKLETFVDSLPNGKLMQDIAADFRASSKELSSLIAALNAKDSALRSFSDRETAQRLAATMASVQSAAMHLDSVAKKIDSGQGTLGAMVNDPSLYDDMRKLMGRANRSKAAKFIIQQVLDGADEKAPAGP